MNTAVKLIKNKVGLLKQAEELGNVSHACKLLVTVETAFVGLRNCMKKEENWHCRR